MITRPRLLVLLPLLLLLAYLPAQLSLAQTTAVLLPNAKQTFVDLNGQPLAGGSVYFYIPNTTTSKTTWQDAAETVPNANPVVLDAAGRAVVFGSGAYRQLVKDQFGNTIWDQLTYAPTTAAVATITALQALGATSPGVGLVYVYGYNSATGPGGGWFAWNPSSVAAADSCVTFAATGVGTGRWIRQLDKSTPLSVEDCGAYNDGTQTTATTTAIQAGVNYIEASNNPNATLTMFGHNYSINATITITNNGGCANILGGGMIGTSIQAGAVGASVETPVFLFTGSGGAECDGGLRNLQITGGAHAIGCEILSVSNVTCEIGDFEGQQPFLFCSCSSGGYVENSLVSAKVSQTAIGGFVRLAEFRTTTGTGSFRNSGVEDSTQVSLNSNIAGPLVFCAATSFCYQSHFGGVYTADATSGTTILLQNLANYRAYVITSGHVRVELAGSNVIKFVDLAHQQVYFEGTFDMNGEINSPTAGFITGPLVQSSSWGITAGGVVEVHKANALYTTKTFTGTSGVTLDNSPLSGTTTWSMYNVEITYTDYDWIGTVSVTGNTGTSCAVVIVSGLLVNNVAGFGAPTPGCSGGAPHFTNGGYPNATMTANYLVNVP